jgi:flagellar motor switch/type III secretory pathway protein FliN
MAAVTVAPYPWSSLERVPRALVRRLTELREQPWEVGPDGLADALSALTGAAVTATITGFGLGPPARRWAELGLSWAKNGAVIGAEPALVLALLERVLARPPGLARPSAELEPSLRGAYGALAVEVARRVLAEPVELAVDAQAAPDALRLDVTVALEGRAYASYAVLSLAAVPALPRPRVELATLGALELGIPLVVARSLARPSELRQLAPGAAFVPGERAWVDAQGVGKGALVAPCGQRGVWVELPADGRLVLTHDLAELAPDQADSGGGMEADDLNETLTNAALEAPVVVRVELAAVSMPASDWARLRPGDVIETGRRVAEPVVLRIAGRVVARGELCDVDGEVGVRVRELVGFKPEG